MKTASLDPTRRDFLSNVLPAGAAACLGCKSLCGFFLSAEQDQQAAEQSRFLAESKFTYKEIFDFTFGYYYIPTLQGLRGQFKGDFIEAVRKGSEESGRRSAKNFAANVPTNDFETFKTWATNPEPFWEAALTWEIVESTDEAFEVKISECLWAKTFRDADAADIGYAGICHGDYAYASAYNPKLHMERTKTLMQGHDCCDHRWLWEG
jgi:hypothetical protein